MKQHIEDRFKIYTVRERGDEGIEIALEITWKTEAQQIRTYHVMYWATVLYSTQNDDAAYAFANGAESAIRKMREGVIR
jgi:hypothetical protein